MKALLTVAISIAFTGCVSLPPPAVWSPDSVAVSGKLASGMIKPICDERGCKAFSVSLQNLTAKPVEIDWNKSYYLRSSQTDGGLMTEGVLFAQRNFVRPPDMILASGSYKKTMWPSNNMDFMTGTTEIGWVTARLRPGKHGIFLTLRQNDVEEQLTAEMRLEGIEDDDGQIQQGAFPKLPSLKAGGINLINSD
tara:strand:- start:219 stop:800 length:582 start_codon:yes stop_codon:yes gene_type:complete